MYSKNTINTTVDKDTHKTWKVVSKLFGLTMKDTFSVLVTKEAIRNGKKVPRRLIKLWEDSRQ